MYDHRCLKQDGRAFARAPPKDCWPHVRCERDDTRPYSISVAVSAQFANLFNIFCYGKLVRDI